MVRNGLMIVFRRFFLLLVIAIASTGYFTLQGVIGSLPIPVCTLGDRLQEFTAAFNEALHVHPDAADALIISYSTIGDFYVLFCLVYSIWKKSPQIILSMVLFIVLRQLMQILVTFPLARGMIWHYPGFPSLFVSYNVSSDFYFSAYVGMNLLITLMFMKYKIRWLTVIGFAIVFLEAFIDIVLRSHYVPDLYTSVIVAVFIYLVMKPFIEQISQKIHSRWVLILLIILGGFYYYILQYLIGLKPISTCGVIDQIQRFFSSLNEWMQHHPYVADASLILLNGILDLAFLWIVGWTLYSGNIRIFLPIALFLGLRQILQLLVSLPLPEGLIWHYPGFPSLFQSYKIGNDLYFSGHSGVSLILLLECIRARRFVVAGTVIFSIIIFLLLILRVHYTMDIFTAILTAFCLYSLSEKLSPPINRWIKQGFLKTYK